MAPRLEPRWVELPVWVALQALWCRRRRRTGSSLPLPARLSLARTDLSTCLLLLESLCLDAFRNLLAIKSKFLRASPPFRLSFLDGIVAVIYRQPSSSNLEIVILKRCSRRYCSDN